MLEYLVRNQQYKISCFKSFWSWHAPQRWLDFFFAVDAAKASSKTGLYFVSQVESLTLVLNFLNSLIASCQLSSTLLLAEDAI